MHNLIKTDTDGVFMTHPGTFVLDNADKIAEYKKNRAFHEAKEKDLLDMKQKINTLNDDVSEIKNMLKLLMQKVS